MCFCKTPTEGCVRRVRLAFISGVVAHPPLGGGGGADKYKGFPPPLPTPKVYSHIQSRLGNKHISTSANKHISGIFNGIHPNLMATVGVLSRSNHLLRNEFHSLHASKQGCTLSTLWVLICKIKEFKITCKENSTT